jgi:hypothetical protein
MPEAFAAGAMQAAARQQQQGHSTGTSAMSVPPVVSNQQQLQQPQHQLQQKSLNGMMNSFMMGMALPSMPPGVGPVSAEAPPPTSCTSAGLLSIPGAQHVFDEGSRPATTQHPPAATGSGGHQVPGKHLGGDLTVEERQQQNRDRNREHARSTRLRKKAYVAKLKELVEGLHAERTEEVRQRRIAIQSLSEMQNVRRSVVRSFLRYYAGYETDDRKWNTLVEEKFFLKQPVTPYRSFRSSEIDKVMRLDRFRVRSARCLLFCKSETLTHSSIVNLKQAHHYSRGLPSVLCDAASLSVMIESIGSKSQWWMQRKREELMLLEAARRGSKNMPSCLVRQDSRLHHAISSLSSSSGSSNHASSGEEGGDSNIGSKNNSNNSGTHIPGSSLHATGLHKHGSPSGRLHRPMLGIMGSHQDSNESVPVAQVGTGTTKVSSSSGSSNDSRGKHDASNDFHDYHAKPLLDPEPVMDSDRNSSTSADDDSPAESNSSANTETKRITTDSSSGDDSAAAAAATLSGPPAYKRRKVENIGPGRLSAGEAAMVAASAVIAKKGGIPHNIKTTVATDKAVANGAARLSLVAPAVPLRPFAGIGKSRNRGADDQDSEGKNGVTSEIDSSSVSTVSSTPQIRASFHINEDDMILMDDVLMCPFTFRTQDAVVCGALSECAMPGMLRAHFSERNKLLSLELVYDAMGFMQQLERASGREGAAQVIPSTLEMALSPSASDARVISTAKPPFQVVNVNDVWTQITGYTQLEVEGEPYLSLMEGEGTVLQANERRNKPKYDLEEVSKGRSACTTNIHYDKAGNDFMEYVCSYPLTRYVFLQRLRCEMCCSPLNNSGLTLSNLFFLNAIFSSSGEVTHLLHVSNELPSFHGELMDQ